MRDVRAILILAAGVLAAGCGKPAPPSGPVDVKGQAVDAEGKPLARMVLRFFPQDEANKSNRLSCPTQADGSFIGKCLPGRYKVTLGTLATPPADGKPADKPKGPLPLPPLPDNIPKAYASETDTPWEVTVPAGGKSNILLKIE